MLLCVTKFISMRRHWTNILYTSIKWYYSNDFFFFSSLNSNSKMKYLYAYVNTVCTATHYRFIHDTHSSKYAHTIGCIDFFRRRRRLLLLQRFQYTSTGILFLRFHSSMVKFIHIRTHLSKSNKSISIDEAKRDEEKKNLPCVNWLRSDQQQQQNVRRFQEMREYIFGWQSV